MAAMLIVFYDLGFQEIIVNVYSVPNLAQKLVFVKFDIKYSIAVENAFYTKMSNFSIGTLK